MTAEVLFLIRLGSLSLLLLTLEHLANRKSENKHARLTGSGNATKRETRPKKAGAQP